MWVNEKPWKNRDVRVPSQSKRAAPKSGPSCIRSGGWSIPGADYGERFALVGEAHAGIDRVVVLFELTEIALFVEVRDERFVVDVGRL